MIRISRSHAAIQIEIITTIIQFYLFSFQTPNTMIQSDSAVASERSDLLDQSKSVELMGSLVEKVRTKNVQQKAQFKIQKSLTNRAYLKQVSAFYQILIFYETIESASLKDK